MPLNKPLTIVLLVSSGWGVRTFLQTDVLPVLQCHGRVVVFASPDLAPALRERLGEDVPVEPLHPFDPKAGAYGRAYRRRNHRFLRLASTGTRRLKQADYRRTLKGLKRLSFDLLELDARLFARREGLPAMMERERRLLLRDHLHAPQAAEYERRLREHGADLVVSTLPHAHEEAPPAIVARHLGIRTAAWINSWDNLTSKPAYYTGYDHYFVWSERVRSELLRYYPEAGPATVDVTGVPHFDWYRQDSMLMPREELFAAYGFDPRRPLVLYGAATPHLAPSEHLVVERLARDLAATETQLLVRTHPGDDGGRFLDLKSNFFALQIPGQRGKGRIDGYCPTDEENREMVSTIQHADVVVNLASTLTLDAAVCDRPVVNVAFDPQPQGSLARTVDKYYTDYDHYRTVVEHGAVRLARSPEELSARITDYLRDPGLDREGRRRVAELWCGPLDGQSGRRLAASLLGRIGERRRR
ncbi:MAG TPA: hypothetical protein VH394_21665 [Thermoanaerobaculia bacterium]|jgi:hypothetical protein|nr:hypothetical protein [Thermoanaerobaculia bacterium]